MNRITEAKAAWTLWILLKDRDDLLWKLYKNEFHEFLINDEDPLPLDCISIPPPTP